MHTVGNALAFDAETPTSLQDAAGGVVGWLVEVSLSDDPPPHPKRRDRTKIVAIDLARNMLIMGVPNLGQSDEGGAQTRNANIITQERSDRIPALLPAKEQREL